MKMRGAIACLRPSLTPTSTKKAAALFGIVVEINPVVYFPALSQEGAVLKHPVELHDWGEA
jgi:hypothetical protein